VLASPVPDSRIRRLNARSVNPNGTFVLYWMTTARRAGWNFGLQRAVERCLALGQPLVVLEALRTDYPWASERFHQFILQGMADNAADFAHTQALYYPYIEPARGEGKGLIAALSEHACAIVTDWYPAFFLPRMLASAAARCSVELEAVDSNGLIPLTAAGRAFPVARSQRALVQRTLATHLQSLPDVAPAARLGRLPRLRRLPRPIAERWPAADPALLSGGPGTLAALPIDHRVGTVSTAGGSRAGRKRLEQFLGTQLTRYIEDHNHPDLNATSRLSPYLHFGHLSAHEVFAALATHERWTTRKLGGAARGAREGWWGMSPSAEDFIDQLVVWRELAFNTCEYVPDYHTYASLPAWARRTLEDHANDPRPHLYTSEQLEAADTSDPVWNAAQRQLVAEGWFNGYLRMLWGKKILEWSPTPAEALERMERLMNRYSLDGRDPNAWAGYAWVLGRYDRPWPERPVFGTVRYMTSGSTQRKLKMKAFLRRFGGSGDQDLLDLEPPAGTQCAP
jgi:deoxyribodipyrimidine photo-lyase